MKIGILTFQSHLNYGGLLQCWALQTALEKLGHEVVVMDRWLDADNRCLLRGYAPERPMSLAEFVHSLLRVGDVRWRRRVMRTVAFVRGWLHLTPFHFVDWKEVSAEQLQQLHLDALVVGSDQIWHCGSWGDPRPYLLEGAIGLNQVRKLAYAASFGLGALPEHLGKWAGEQAEEAPEPYYRRGLARFDAIGCREAEGVRLCESLGFAAKHVVDPTQLLEREDWAKFAKPKLRRQLTCYFLSENVDVARPRLMRFARAMNCRVRVLVYDAPREQDWLPTPNSWRTAKRWVGGCLYRWRNRRVQVLESAGPQEFVREHAECSWVVTDSFHSLMFATIFGKNVRVLRPKDENRRKMFARMDEYAAHARGNLIADDLDSALASLERSETAAIDADWLKERRAESLKFIREKVRG